MSQYDTLYDLEKKEKSTGNDSSDPVICCCHGIGCDLAGRHNADNYVNLFDMNEQKKDKEVFPRKDKLRKDTPKEKTLSRKMKDEEIFPRKDKPKKKEDEEIFPRKDKKKECAKAQDSLLTANLKIKAIEAAAVSQRSSYVGHEDIFIGASTFLNAENSVRNEIGFCLYYRLPTKNEANDLEEELHLHLAYKIDSKNYRHFRIKERRQPTELYIDYGNPRAQGYSTLDKLIRALKKKVRLAEKPFPTISQMAK